MENNNNWVPSEGLLLHDVFVFICLELLGTLAVTGNVCLIIVLLKNKYLNRASFILMLSLAIADVLHGIVTTCYFYPPIIIKETVPEFVIRIFNIIDWTAWSITLTHMSAICLDRLVAIMLYGKYNQIVTVKRVKRFSLLCWFSFIFINIIYFIFNFCCLIRPLKNSHYYTFGYDENNMNDKSFLGDANMYMYTYTPIELITLGVLSISNPITLVQLYRRHKRKIALRQHAPQKSVRSSVKARSQWQRASTMLLEMSIRMGSKPVMNDVREMASRRANRQQQRILVQISVVAVIFYLYMTTYYLVYYIFETENKWVMLFNSFFYSTTHMINPVIYFSLNKEMRAQLVQAVTEFLAFICCAPTKTKLDYGSMIKPSNEHKTSNKMENSYTATETSPLFSSTLTNHKQSNLNATLSKLQKDTLNNSLICITNNNNPNVTLTEYESETQPLMEKNEIIIQNNKNIENIDSNELIKAQEQRKTLLEALIKALNNFTSQIPEDESNEVVAAVLESHLSRYHPQSRSFDISRRRNDTNLKTSNTLQCVSVQEIEKQNNKYDEDEKFSLSPRNNALGQKHNYLSSDELRINKSSSFQRTHNTNESLTLLLEDSFNTSDDEDVIYL